MFKLTYVYIYMCVYLCGTFKVALVLKNLPANAGDIMRCWFHLWARKIPWRGAWQPTPVFLPAESHGQKNLVGYNPWDHKELDMTEATYIYKLNFLYIKTFK